MLLEQGWSPEQISDRLKKEQKVCISHEWIYQYILKDKQAGGELYRHLRCKKKYRCAIREFGYRSACEKSNH